MTQQEGQRYMHAKVLFLTEQKDDLLRFLNQQANEGQEVLRRQQHLKSEVSKMAKGLADTNATVEGLSKHMAEMTMTNIDLKKTMGEKERRLSAARDDIKRLVDLAELLKEERKGDQREIEKVNGKLTNTTDFLLSVLGEKRATDEKMRREIDGLHAALASLEKDRAKDKAEARALEIAFLRFQGLVGIHVPQTAHHTRREDTTAATAPSDVGIEAAPKMSEARVAVVRRSGKLEDDPPIPPAIAAFGEPLTSLFSRVLNTQQHDTWNNDSWLGSGLDVERALEKASVGGMQVAAGQGSESDASPLGALENGRVQLPNVTTVKVVHASLSKGKARGSDMKLEVSLSVE